MNERTLILEAVFWLCAAVVIYHYLVYPPLIWLLARWFGRADVPAEMKDQDLPVISVLISVYNEQAVIQGRIENLLKLDYPREKLDIVIASDGSSDRTVEIARQFPNQGVRVLDYRQRRGKTAVLNTAIATLTADLVVLSDANTFFEPSAARHLTRWFVDRSVGVVCGKLVLVDSHTGSNSDGMYWRYETFMKISEGKLGALLGSNGAIYAIRRGIFPTIPGGTIVDDFVIPLLAKLNTDCQIIYDQEAVAHEEIAPEIKDEFRRRTRIGAGGYQAIGLLWRLLNPRHGWIALSFFSHKVLRWFCPFFLIGTLICSGLLWHHLFYGCAFAVQAAVLVLSPFVSRIPGRNMALKLVRLAAMFSLMNDALFLGFLSWIWRRQTGVWKRTARVAERHQAGASLASKQPQETIK